MLQRIRHYMPDDAGRSASGAGAGNDSRENKDYESDSADDSNRTGEGDESSFDVEDTNDSNPTGSSSVNLDDNLGDAELGTANMPSSAGPEGVTTTGQDSPVTIDNVSQLDRSVDTDASDDDSTNVGFGGDLSSPGMGTLDDLGTAESNYSDGFAQNETSSSADLSGPGNSSGLGSMNGSGIDPNLNLSSESEASTNDQSDQNRLTSPEEAKQKKQKTILAVAVCAALIGGLWLLTRRQNNSTAARVYNKAKNRASIDSASKSVENTLSKAAKTGQNQLDALIDSAKGTYHNAKAAVEEALV